MGNQSTTLCVLCGLRVQWFGLPNHHRRGFYADSFPGTEADAGLAGDFLSDPSRRTITVRPGARRSAPSRMVRGSAVGEERDLGISQNLDFADDSITTSVEACTSTFGAERILPETNRVRVFKRLGGSVEGIGHMGVDAEMPSWSVGHHSSGNRFVIREGLAERDRCRDGEVVHVPRGGRDAVRIACASAFRRRSTIRWSSTLPPATARVAWR